MVGEYLDLTSDPGNSEAGRQSGERGTTGGRSFLGVHFRCCDVYARIYADEALTAYRGHCPRCAKPVMVRIGPGGSDSRFFDVG
jgi:hypothetical protein